MISVCLIVKNEEELLEGALQSIPQEYQVVITDTGSSDRTVEIAKKFTPYVFNYAWNNHFADARNYCASKATGDYILMMDADERLPEDTNIILHDFISKFPKMAGAVTLESATAEEINRNQMIRFYPNLPEFSYFGAVHEQLTYHGNPANYTSMSLVIQHLGYEEELYKRRSKKERYLSLYLEHLQQVPNDGYMLYQVGKLLYSTDDHQRAEYYLRKSLEESSVKRPYYPGLIVMLGYLLKDTGRSTEAMALIRQSEIHFPDCPDIAFLKGILAMDTGEIAEIERSFLQALAAGETTKYPSVVGTGSFKAAFNLGVFYELTGNKTKAHQFYEYSASFHYNPAQERLKTL